MLAQILPGARDPPGRGVVDRRCGHGRFVIHGDRSPLPDQGFQRLDLRPAPAVAGFLHEPPRLGDVLARFFRVALREREPGVFEMGIALEEPHLAAPGDPHRLVQIAPGRRESPVSRNKAARASRPRGSVMHCARLAQAVDRLVELRPGLAKLAQRQRRPAEGEVI